MKDTECKIFIRQSITENGMELDGVKEKQLIWFVHAESLNVNRRPKKLFE